MESRAGMSNELGYYSQGAKLGLIKTYTRVGRCGNICPIGFQNSYDLLTATCLVFFIFLNSRVKEGITGFNKIYRFEYKQKYMSKSLGRRCSYRS